METKGALTHYCLHILEKYLPTPSSTLVHTLLPAESFGSDFHVSIYLPVCSLLSSF